MCLRACAVLMYCADVDVILIFISLLTRMRCKRDVKMGRLCTPGGAVVGIVGGV